MKWWVHVLLFFLTGGLYLVLYIPYLLLRSFSGGSRNKTKSRPKQRTAPNRSAASRSASNRAVGESIYLIHAVGTNRYKIGRTNNMDRRWRELNRTKGPHELELVMHKQVRDSHVAENNLHKSFRKHRKHGEWFDLNSKRLRQVKKSMKSQP